MRLDENLELLIILIGNRAVKKAQEENSKNDKSNNKT